MRDTFLSFHVSHESIFMDDWRYHVFVHCVSKAYWYYDSSECHSVAVAILL